MKKTIVTLAYRINSGMMEMYWNMKNFYEFYMLGGFNSLKKKSKN